jgi:hypothetical protein
VIEKSLKLIEENYFSAEVSRRARMFIERQMAAGAYNSIVTGRTLAQRLTADLRGVMEDRHVMLNFSFDPIPPLPDGPPPPEVLERIAVSERKQNWGLRDVARLDGNLGSFRLDGFANPVTGSEAVTAAVTFLQHTEALVVDLRSNFGGDPNMVARIASHLFPGRVHLNSIYWGREQRRMDFFTDPDVKGPKFTRPVYVLTSGATFSAGEEFTYDLQAQGRAVIVGEVTGGGANPGGFLYVTNHFGVFVPTGRAVNPITGTNWEGVGVRPDVRVPADAALKTAQVMALLDLLLNPAGLPPGQVDEIQRALAKLLSSPSAPVPPAAAEAAARQFLEAVTDK